METRNTPTLCATLCALLLLPLGGAVAAGPPAGPSTEDAVVLTGWLHVEEHTMADVVLEVTVNGTMRTVTVSESGRFTVALPADAEATLRFEKPGHLSKELVVDTRHAQDGNFDRRTRRLKFAVIMHQQRHMGKWIYSGPVGAIRFEDGGCPAVANDRSLVPADRHTPMVF
jgi:hypothetical protein